jgi:hypothetical protein
MIWRLIRDQGLVPSDLASSGSRGGDHVTTFGAVLFNRTIYTVYVKGSYACGKLGIVSLVGNLHN